MSNDSVIAVLSAAVDQEPNNIELRLHLASLLLDGGDGLGALSQAEAVLGIKPDNLLALDQAARAAALSGDEMRATSFRRLHDALAGSMAPTKPEASGTIIEDVDLDEPPPSLTVFGGDAEVADQPVDQVLDPSDEIWDIEEPALKLADVGGMENVKQRLETAFLGPLRNSELMKYYGKSLRGGLLLYGPPGCGKTFIARATAGEMGAKFIAVGLSDVLDMWIGSSEKNLHEIFERARRQAPCVLFFDELDALGRKRTLVRHSPISGVVNQLLAEIDSVGNNNDGVFILAATNHPWDVDTAMRRPGRLDRLLLVLPPDLPARVAILEYHLRERPLGKLDLKALAKQTEGFSGADLAHLCESAAELGLAESVKTGQMRPIEMSELNQALKHVRPSTRAWFDTARNVALFANEGGIYDELLEYLKKNRML